MRNRNGFTVIELAIVSTLVGLLTMIAWPHLAQARESARLQGAKRHVITQVLAARSSAIQRGQPVQLRTVANEVWLTTSIGGTQTAISPRAELLDVFGVEVRASHDPITYDQRGYATSLPLTGGKFVLALGGTRDSVCVTRFGAVVQECGL